MRKRSSASIRCNFRIRPPEAIVHTFGRKACKCGYRKRTRVCRQNKAATRWTSTLLYPHVGWKHTESARFLCPPSSDKISWDQLWNCTQEPFHPLKLANSSNWAIPRAPQHLNHRLVLFSEVIILLGQKTAYADNWVFRENKQNIIFQKGC